MVENGRELVSKALRREGLPVQKVLGGASLDEVATSLNFADTDALYTAVGEHHLSPESVANKVGKLLRGTEPDREEVVPTPTRRHRRRAPGDKVGVHIEGFDDVMVRIARCCLEKILVGKRCALLAPLDALIRRDRDLPPGEALQR